MNAAEFSELLQRRRSIRSFLPTPLPTDAIDEILEDARHIPSWSNTHPYCVAVASGERLERVRKRYVEAFDASLTLRANGTNKTSGADDAVVDPLSPDDLARLTRLGTPDGDFATRLPIPCRTPTGHSGAREVTGNHKMRMSEEDQRPYGYHSGDAAK